MTQSTNTQADLTATITDRREDGCTSNIYACGALVGTLDVTYDANGDTIADEWSWQDDAGVCPDEAATAVHHIL